MEHSLSLRPTAIGEQREQGDYTVFLKEEVGERPIGRIRHTFHHVNNAPEWNWSITVPLPMGAWSRGSAASLDAAKEAFRSAWEQFYDGLTPEQIARWHHTQDARR
jgi:hypothetical protein